MVTIDASDRILIIVPHPDDETLGTGGIIQRAIKLDVPIKLIYLTYGDANEWSFIKSNIMLFPTLRPSSVKKMGYKRYKEALEATKVLGLDQDHIIFLGYPDFGTLKIWYKHWRKSKPARGLFTRSIKVPYKTAYRPGAKYYGEELLKDLKDIMGSFKPTKVFTSHRLDYNGDHQGLYLFVRIAIWDLKDLISPQIYPFLTHFKSWPQPRGLRPNEYLEPLDYFDNINWQSFDLEKSEVKRKEKALRKHKTQISTTPNYLFAFIRQNELFGDFRTELSAKYLENEYHQKGENYLVQEQMNQMEELNFTGLDDHSIQITKDHLIEKIHFIRKLKKRSSIIFYLFAYSYNEEFGESPKYRIKITKQGVDFLDIDKKLDSSDILIEHNSDDNTIKMMFPLYLLNDPDILLINVRNIINRKTVDWVPWRIIRM